MIDKVFTEGEKRVGLSFNPSRNGKVYAAKKTYADSIDEMLALNTRSGNIAATEMESACMWHVKALTEHLNNGYLTVEKAAR